MFFFYGYWIKLNHAQRVQRLYMRTDAGIVPTNTFILEQQFGRAVLHPEKLSYSHVVIKPGMFVHINNYDSARQLLNTINRKVV